VPDSTQQLVTERTEDLPKEESVIDDDYDL
jgi:hypothetical protein